MKGSLLVSHLITLFVTLSTQSPVMASLRIAVPPKIGFTQFVKISSDPSTGQQHFSGFAIEVFNQAVSATVDNSISFEFIPFQRPDGTMNGTYDDMVEAVFKKEYDGAVGDIGIRFSRTQWVDFTVSYIDVGISMLIPVQRGTTNNDVNSLNSLTGEMVIGTFVIFFLSILVFVGADIFNLVFGRTQYNTIQPRRLADGVDPNAINRLKEKEDAWKRELLGTVRGTRLMMLLCFLILLFLITYYAISLISLLGREQSIAPTKSINQIIRTGERVGYSEGSFVYNLLKEVGVPDKQLFPYRSEDDLLDMFTKGIEDGGVTVAIAETPLLSIFLAKHCSNYTLVSTPSLHTAGYGFAFSIGSDLVQKVSNGIIKLIDNGELEKIKARTIGGIGTCDVDPGVDTISDIAFPNISRTFKVCAILAMALVAVIYAVFIITNNCRCLRYLFP